MRFISLIGAVMCIGAISATISTSAYAQVRMENGKMVGPANPRQVRECLYVRGKLKCYSPPISRRKMRMR